MMSIISKVGALGLIYILGYCMANLRSFHLRRQHQRDVTVDEIRRLRKRLCQCNLMMAKNINNSEALKLIKLQTVSILGSWSVNIVFNRINKRMVIYSLKPLLTGEYTILQDLIQDPPSNKPLEEATANAKRLFKLCDIIS